MKANLPRPTLAMVATFIPASALATGFAYTDGQKIATEAVTQTAQFVGFDFNDTVGGDK
ncbi:MAG: hypothetical protein ACI8XO_005118 [Verrucomicrobiales bacterium]|jgi:hypothetical protein